MDLKFIKCPDLSKVEQNRKRGYTNDALICGDPIRLPQKVWTFNEVKDIRGRKTLTANEGSENVEIPWVEGMQPYLGKYLIYAYFIQMFIYLYLKTFKYCFFNFLLNNKMMLCKFPTALSKGDCGAPVWNEEYDQWNLKTLTIVAVFEGWYSETSGIPDGHAKDIWFTKVTNDKVLKFIKDIISKK